MAVLRTETVVMSALLSDLPAVTETQPIPVVPLWQASFAAHPGNTSPSHIPGL